MLLGGDWVVSHKRARTISWFDVPEKMSVETADKTERQAIGRPAPGWAIFIGNDYFSILNSNFFFPPPIRTVEWTGLSRCRPEEKEGGQEKKKKHIKVSAEGWRELV